jgi:hypothetical protein
VRPDGALSCKGGHRHDQQELLTGNATDLWPAFLAAANRTSDSYLAKENGTGTRAEFEAAFADQRG